MKVLDIRNDNSPNINVLVTQSDDDIIAKAYNGGWTDLNHISFSVLPGSEFYDILKVPENFNKDFDVFEYGQLYELGVLKIDDVKVEETGILPEFKFTYKMENESESFDCMNSSPLYMYNKESGKFSLAPMGGPPEYYPIGYYINVENGIFDYEIPLFYSCEAHSYEEIGFWFSANKSCHVRYSLELYSNDKLLFKTKEKGINIRINSYYGPPETDIGESPILFKW